MNVFYIRGGFLSKLGGKLLMGFSRHCLNWIAGWVQSPSSTHNDLWRGEFLFQFILLSLLTVQTKRWINFSSRVTNYLLNAANKVIKKSKG